MLLSVYLPMDLCVAYLALVISLFALYLSLLFWLVFYIHYFLNVSVVEIKHNQCCGV